MSDDLPYLLLAAFGMGSSGGDRFTGRTRVEDDDRDDQREDSDDDGDDPGDSTLGRLLRHPTPVARGGRVDNAGAPAQSRGAVHLSWIERNRIWLVPWVSALLVVGIEIGAALFASKPIPMEGHTVLGAFWIFAVGRGSARALTMRQQELRLEQYARRRGIPLDSARDEWHVFQEAVGQTALPRGKDTP